MKSYISHRPYLVRGGGYVIIVGREHGRRRGWCRWREAKAAPFDFLFGTENLAATSHSSSTSCEADRFVNKGGSWHPVPVAAAAKYQGGAKFALILGLDSLASTDNVLIK